MRSGTFAIAAAFLLTWTPHATTLPGDRFIVERATDPEFAGAIDTVGIHTHAGAVHEDSLVDYVTTGQRFFYRVRCARSRINKPDTVSAPSAPMSGLYLQFVPDTTTDTSRVYRWAGGDKRTLVVAVLPRGSWRLAWALRMWVIGAPTYEWVEPWSNWDTNRDKRINLSDFAGATDALHDPVAFEQFVALYGRSFPFWFAGSW